MQLQLKKYGSKKESVILHPGWTHPIENEAIFLKELTKKYTCYSIHLPGYYGVPDSDETYSFKDFAESLQKILLSEQIKPVAHIGFSMGCRMVMTYDQVFPSSVKKIYVGCPFDLQIPAWGIFLLAHEGLWLGMTRTYGVQSAVVSKAYRTITGDPHAKFHSPDVTLKGAFYSLLALLKSEPTTSNSPDSLFIYGKKDPYLLKLPEAFKTQTKIIPGAVHNCVAGREQEIVEILEKYIRNK